MSKRQGPIRLTYRNHWSPQDVPSLYDLGRLDRGGRDFNRNGVRDAGYRPGAIMPGALAVPESVVSPESTIKSVRGVEDEH